MWRREFFSRFRKRCGNKGNISKALFIPLKIFVPSDAKAPLISIKEEIEPVPPVGKIELVRRGFQPHRRLEFLPGKKKKNVSLGRALCKTTSRDTCRDSLPQFQTYRGTAAADPDCSAARAAAVFACCEKRASRASVDTLAPPKPKLF